MTYDVSCWVKVKMTMVAHDEEHALDDMVESLHKLKDAAHQEFFEVDTGGSKDWKAERVD